MKSMTRIACAAAGICLGFAMAPVRAQATQPDPFVALQLSPEFMIAHLRYELGPSLLWDRLVPVDHYSVQALPNRRPDAWSDASVKELLTSVDAALTRWTAPVARSHSEQVALIQQQYARLPAGFRNPKDGLAYDPKFIQWTQDHCDFIREAADVVAFTQLLQHLRPGSIESPHLPGGYDRQFAVKNGLPFGTEMAAISAVVDLPRAQDWLPARFDLKRLRARERELRQEDERHAYDYEGRASNTEVVMTAQRVREAWIQGPLRDTVVQMTEEIDRLGQRLARGPVQ